MMARQARRELGFIRRVLRTLFPRADRERSADGAETDMNDRGNATEPFASDWVRYEQTLPKMPSTSDWTGQ